MLLSAEDEARQCAAPWSRGAAEPRTGRGNECLTPPLQIWSRSSPGREMLVKVKEFVFLWTEVWGSTAET